jgi:NAD(P)-dependent dehydrogenase (short-subunit alcohol dehydrogenase family)
MKFRNKTVVVTGAASGIGKTLAAAYAAHGAHVVMADVGTVDGERGARAIRESGGSAVFVKTDVGKEKDAVRLVAKTLSTFGTLDILVNNAGIGRPKPPTRLRLADWDAVLRTNLYGTFLCSREAAKRMKRRGGAIVNIASTRALMSEPNSEAYAASKGGIVALTHALAISLGPERIRVNCISPGWIETKSYDDLRPADHRQHPAGRVGKTEDVARACFYLTDPANDFVTGVNLVVDGGMTRKMIYEG